MKLAHICFADDLLVFCHGDEKSVRVIKKALDDFGQVSGLSPNISKSTVLFGSVPNATQLKIIQVLPFSVGKLPVKYLGVSLLSKKLNIKDYEIDNLLKGFRWCQGDNVKRISRVAWKDICVPKDQGGLGVKPLREWNETLLVKNLWRVFAHKDTLWSKWVNLEKLKGGSICYKWKTNNGSVVNYSTPQVWSDLKSNRIKVVWHHVIWFQGLEPKHSFIMCGCIWKDLKSKLIFRGLPNDLDSIVQRMAVYPFTKNIWNVVNRLALAACVYFIWQERNSRLFRNPKKAAKQVGDDIQNFIRWKLLSLTVKSSIAVKKDVELWNLKWANNQFRQNREKSRKSAEPPARSQPSRRLESRFQKFKPEIKVLGAQEKHKAAAG
ncbi:uncharacterized protein [Rutidosis leptorrhynchoides]|uniref:uncharacterized protein n=1 Tax=Rutidosis leptorrhynchoides TaxID=125765 RepID=UPI003A9A1F88